LATTSLSQPGQWRAAPTTVYRLQPDGELEMMLSCGWNKSVSNEMTGLDKISEGDARFIQAALDAMRRPNDQAEPRGD
jgi:hypothetical protein